MSAPTTMRSFFGSHLYNQIVIPLLVAAIIVAAIAWGVAVYFLGSLTDKWAAQIAQDTTLNVVQRVSQYSQELDQIAAVAAEDTQLHAALGGGDSKALSVAVAKLRVSSGIDQVDVLDSSGGVVASAGYSVLPGGSRPWPSTASNALVGTVRMAPLGQTRTLTAFEGLTTPRGFYSIALSRRIDDAFLTEIAGGAGTGFCLYGGDRSRLACAISPGLPSAEATALTTALKLPDPVITRALSEVHGNEPGIQNLSVAGRRYQVWARGITLGGQAGAEPDAYLIGVVSQRVSADAGRATGNLIAMWSFFAVVALVGLGGWVARRVSDPLEELALSARRVAEGDFSTKVVISGTNEVTELADSFNLMTDSLRERSESLTKKVLELATLYEMSRSLGSTLELNELLESVLDSALRIFDLDLGYVTLRDKDTGQLTVLAARGALEGTGDAVRSSISEWVVREGRPLIFNPEKAGAEMDAVTGARAALCVPLVSSEGTVGAITVGSSDPEYRFNSDDVRLLSTIANHVTIAIGNIDLFSSLQEAYLATVRSLAAAVDAKDSYTRGHSDRVATYATIIAERMGLSHEQRVALEMAAYLHDIGKIGVREEILLKPGRLDDSEMAQMRHHPLIGANILKPIAFPWAITPVVRHHHEHWDGSGYPAGLRGEEIPLLARILTVADSFEAMTADRPYRSGRDEADAIEELRRCSGTQFDPRIVDVFAGILEEFEHTGEPLIVEPHDDVSPEEARAIFSALVDGVLGSFRRLGGPRLASNAERELDTWLDEHQAPYRIVRGKMQFQAEVPLVADAEVEQMRAALRRLDEVMSGVSGSTLVDHFYADALTGLSNRMRMLVRELGFYTG